MMFDRITFDPGIMGGRACIRGMRIPVSVIVGQIARIGGHDLRWALFACNFIWSDCDLVVHSCCLLSVQFVFRPFAAVRF